MVGVMPAAVSIPVPRSQPAGGPDLPEVETLRRFLAGVLVGQKIAAVEVAVPKVLPGRPRAEVVDLFLGRGVERLERHGRCLLLGAAGGTLALPVHDAAALRLGLDETAAAPSGIRLALHLGSGARLWFCGGRAGLSRGPDRSEIAAWTSGVEPLGAAFTLGNFKRILQRKKRSTLQLLVDDELIAGIGERYAGEILFAARIRPTRVIPSLTPDDVRLLYYAIVEVLQKAIRFGGIDSNGGDGPPGTFQRFLAVHGRSGQECVVCKARIRVATMVAARIPFCPRCQK